MDKPCVEVANPKDRTSQGSPGQRLKFDAFSCQHSEKIRVKFMLIWKDSCSDGSWEAITSSLSPSDFPTRVDLFWVTASTPTRTLGRTRTTRIDAQEQSTVPTNRKEGDKGPGIQASHILNSKSLLSLENVTISSFRVIFINSGRWRRR